MGSQSFWDEKDKAKLNKCQKSNNQMVREQQEQTLRQKKNH